MPAAVTSRPGQSRPVRPRIGVPSCLLGEQVRFKRRAQPLPFPHRRTGRARRLGALLSRDDHRAGRPARDLAADHRQAAGQPLWHRRPHRGGRRCPAARGPRRLRAQITVSDVRGSRHRPLPRRRAGADRRGRGVLAQRITEAFPLLPVQEEGRLNDDLLREAFAERVFATARLRDLLSGPWRPRDLIAFHARHKLQLLTHDPGRPLRAGQVVAAAGRRPWAETAAAMAAKPTRGRHANPAAGPSHQRRHAPLAGRPNLPAAVPRRTAPPAQRAWSPADPSTSQGKTALGEIRMLAWLKGFGRTGLPVRR